MRPIIVAAVAVSALACAACTVEVVGHGAGRSSDVAVSAGDPEALRFRLVVRSGPATAGTPSPDRQSVDPDDPAAAQAAVAGLACADPDPLAGADDATRPLLTCDESGETAYLLGPSFLSGEDITTARPEPSRYGTGWVLTVEFSPSAAATWADFTTENVGQQVAIVLDTTVLSAPTIQEAILGGSTQITGDPSQFTREYVKDLAARLGG